MFYCRLIQKMWAKEQSFRKSHLNFNGFCGLRMHCVRSDGIFIAALCGKTILKYIIVISFSSQLSEGH